MLVGAAPPFAPMTKATLSWPSSGVTEVTVGAAGATAVTWKLTGLDVAWARLPLAVFAFGWAMMVPVVTLLVLDLHPERRGMASSLQSFVGASANGLVAGLIAPLVMHSAVALAASSLAMLSLGLLAWLWAHRRWPDIGRTVVHLEH